MNFTPEALAERWQVSSHQVRKLYNSGQLRGFRVGSKLIRFPKDAVEEFERCQMDGSSLDNSKDAGSLSGTKTASDTAHISLATIKEIRALVSKR